jgi:hypothetical protein
MRIKVSGIWILALLVATCCILFPPRRNTEQGQDRESAPLRLFLWSDDLYQGSQTSFGHLGARLDLQRLALELLGISTISGAIVLARGLFSKSETDENKAA